MRNTWVSHLTYWGGVREVNMALFNFKNSMFYGKEEE